MVGKIISAVLIILILVPTWMAVARVIFHKED